MERKINPKDTERQSNVKLITKAMATMAILSSSFSGDVNVNACHEVPEITAQNYENFSDTPSWEQDFVSMENGVLDPNWWNIDTRHEVPTWNGEEQAYTESHKNVRLESGVGLVIEAHPEKFIYEDDPNQNIYNITSARINTKGKFSAEFGRFEATMKMPEGVGVWPAFWLLSDNRVHSLSKKAQNQHEEVSYLSDGELDIVEYYGNNPNQIDGTLHTHNQMYNRCVKVENATSQFNTYGVDVTPNTISWTLNGNTYFKLEKDSEHPDYWPFKGGNQLYMILNLAMGVNAGKPDLSEGPWRLEIQNVSYYGYLENTTKN